MIRGKWLEKGVLIEEKRVARTPVKQLAQIGYLYQKTNNFVTSSQPLSLGKVACSS